MYCTVSAIAAGEDQDGLKIASLTGEVLYDFTWTAGVDYDEDSEEEE